MKKDNEINIVFIIRYSLPIFIIFITIIISLFITYEHQHNLKLEKKSIEFEYIKEQKEQIKSDLERVYAYISNKEKSVKDSLKLDLKDKVNNAYSIISSIYENNKNSKTKNEILNQIKYAIKDLRFSDGKGYFFIYTLEGDVLLNPLFPNLEGKNLWNYKDSKGTYLIQEMNQILKVKNETYYDWYWKDPLLNSDKEYLKVGYFKKFKPYNIFIGTGFYLNDKITSLKKEITNHISQLRYKDDRYVYIIDENNNLIVNKHKSILNKNITKEENLKFLENKIVELKSKEKNGLFFDYDLILENNLSIKKIAYILEFKSFDWVIGTGFTMKSVNKLIKQRQELVEKKYKDYIYNTIVFGIIFVLMILFISYLISRYIEKRFLKYTKDLEDKQNLLIKSQEIAHLGDWQLDVNSMQAYWSDSILNILGIKIRPKEIGPEFLKTIMHKDDWHCFEESIKNALKNHAEHRCSYRIYRPDGTIRWIDCRGEYDIKSNKINGVIQDITERKISEIEKEEKERILYQQSKMAAMGEMIGNIAHQWRQPLSVISTASTSIKLKKEMNLLSDEDLISTMNYINDSTQYLSQTIEDFRTFFTPNEKSSKKINLKILFEKTFNLVNAQFISRGIEVIKEIDDIEFVSLRNELIQVLINILNNSRDVLLGVEGSKYIFIKAFKENDNLIISIYDNGNGIDESIINRIFEPYFTTKYKSQGTGIGLYMSQEIVTKLLKGELVVENIEYEYKGIKYKGAKFTIKIKIS